MKGDVSIMFTKNIKNLVISIVCFLIAASLTAFIVKWDQHALEIANIGVFFFKLLPFVFGLAAICFFPFDDIKNVPLKLLLVLSTFGFFFCYGMAKAIFLFVGKVPYQEFYLLLQLLTPTFILSLALALRCGGMTAKDVAIFGTITIIFMISGIEDLTSQWIRIAIVPGYIVPEQWAWANHMTVFLGRVPSKNEAYVFIAIHFVLMAIILYFAYTKNNLYTWFVEKYIKKQNKSLQQIKNQ